jgi:hypothetical protein
VFKYHNKKDKNKKRRNTYKFQYFHGRPIDSLLLKKSGVITALSIYDLS